nr:hypothetical protein [Nocardioides sp. B-3]
MTTTAATSAPGTAQRRASRSSTNRVISTGEMAAGSAAGARNGSTQSVSSTPANMALATAPGMRATQSPSGLTIAVTR